MEYTIKQLSQLAGVSTRTLRYYDEICLLRPSRVTDTGYRYYGQQEVALLHQILFYRERGFDLKTIQKIIYEKDFDMQKAMEDHLLALENQKATLDSLIQTVRKTIQHMKGEYNMSDNEKFQAFKQKMVQDQEKQYGEEARKKYGDAQVDEANKTLLNLSQEQWERWNWLAHEIRNRLETAVNANARIDSEDGKEIAALHKEWLSVSNKHYSVPMHKGIAKMYVADERFTTYYDCNVPGCAHFLYEAIQHWI